MILAPIIIII